MISNAIFLEQDFADESLIAMIEVNDIRAVWDDTKLMGEKIIFIVGKDDPDPTRDEKIAYLKALDAWHPADPSPDSFRDLMGNLEITQTQADRELQDALGEEGDVFIISFPRRDG